MFKLIDRALGINRVSIVYNGRIEKFKVIRINEKDYVNIYRDMYELCYEDEVAYKVDDLLIRKSLTCRENDYNQKHIVTGGQ